MEDETFPDIGSMSDEELKELIDNLTAEEQEVSYRRRILHGQIDILRAELVNRLRENRPESGTLIKGDDGVSDIIRDRVAVAGRLLTGASTAAGAEVVQRGVRRGDR